MGEINGLNKENNSTTLTNSTTLSYSHNIYISSPLTTVYETLITERPFTGYHPQWSSSINGLAQAD